jgi:hypothetical protein
MSEFRQIANRSVYSQVGLSRDTWLSIELRLYRYFGMHGCNPLALVVHPAQLEELLIALDWYGADLSLLDGVSIQTDERCNVLHVIDHEGQLRKL